MAGAADLPPDAFRKPPADNFLPSVDLAVVLPADLEDEEEREDLIVDWGDIDEQYIKNRFSGQIYTTKCLSINDLRINIKSLWTSAVLYRVL